MEATRTRKRHGRRLQSNRRGQLEPQVESQVVCQVACQLSTQTIYDVGVTCNRIHQAPRCRDENCWIPVIFSCGCSDIKVGQGLCDVYTDKVPDKQTIPEKIVEAIDKEADKWIEQSKIEEIMSVKKSLWDIADELVTRDSANCKIFNSANGAYSKILVK